MIAKAGLGIIGLGAIGIGGVAFAKPEWLGINKEITWTPLSKDHDFSAKSSDDYKSGNFGNKYKYYFVGVVGTDSKAENPNTNKDMWDDLFKKWKEDYDKATGDKSSLGKGFKDRNTKGGIKVEASTNDNDKYLNTVCQEVYKTEASKVDATGSGEDKYKESSVWKYCSGLGGKPETIGDKNENTSRYKTPGTIGNEESNKSKLISTTVNDKFWEIRDKEFRGGDNGYSKIEESGSSDLFFSTSKTKTIRELCEEAYGKSNSKNDDSTDTEPKKDKVLKYCSLDKQ